MLTSFVRAPISARFRGSSRIRGPKAFRGPNRDSGFCSGPNLSHAGARIVTASSGPEWSPISGPEMHLRKSYMLRRVAQVVEGGWNGKGRVLDREGKKGLEGRRRAWWVEEGERGWKGWVALGYHSRACIK